RRQAPPSALDAGAAGTAVPDEGSPTVATADPGGGTGGSARSSGEAHAVRSPATIPVAKRVAARARTIVRRPNRRIAAGKKVSGVNATAEDTGRQDPNATRHAGTRREDP